MAYKPQESKSGYENKPYKRFVKDGDDFIPKRSPIPTKRPAGYVPAPPKKCECGGTMKSRGAIGCAGQSSSKCVKCGSRTYSKSYKGVAGLETFGYEI